MTVRIQRPTLDAFLRWPEQKPYLEYVHGEVRSRAMPDMRQGLVQVALGALLAPWAQANQGWVISEQRCLLEANDESHLVLPDVAWWSSEQLTAVVSGPVRVPPTLAVEILSPDDRYGAVQDKVLIYLTAGVPLVWVIDPLTHSVTIYHPACAPRVVRPPADLRDDLLPGLEIPLANLFARLPARDAPQPSIQEQ